MLRNFGYSVTQKDNPIPTTSDIVLVCADPLHGDRHMWIADGYCSFKTICKEYTSTNMGLTWDLIYEAPNTTESYIHYNWGYDGYDNGFFLTDCTSLNPKDHITLDQNCYHDSFGVDHTFVSNFMFYSVSR